jgi:hypothetical protein
VTPVTILGTNLNGATSVRFNGTAATFLVVSSTLITTSVPPGATTGRISVTTPGGTATSAGDFTVTPPVPTISSFSPASGLVGAAVTLTGTDFGGATGVRFNDTAATFLVVSSTLITTSVPPGATTGRISVTAPGGTATSASDFTVTSPGPTITSLSPSEGAVGLPVTVVGAHLSGTTSLEFNGTSAVYMVISDGLILTAVPPGATTGPISITTPYGTATSQDAFAVEPELVIELWPPNHKLVDFDMAEILGVDGDSIEISSITQDEPVDASSGECDGQGIGTSICRIRAERESSGNGRVYHVHYTALGGLDSGYVAIVIPHDRSSRPAVDDGQKYNSNEGCVPVSPPTR